MNNIPRTVYHQTSKENISKILEFGFDKHLSGQGSLKRLRADNSPRIHNDKFVEYVETMPENQVINATIDPFFLIPNSDEETLRITLKPTARLLDVSTVEKLKGAKWRKLIAYTREKRYDGLIDENYVFLFSNKSISSMSLFFKCSILTNLSKQRIRIP